MRVYGFRLLVACGIGSAVGCESAVENAIETNECLHREKEAYVRLVDYVKRNGAIPSLDGHPTLTPPENAIAGSATTQGNEDRRCSCDPHAIFILNPTATAETVLHPHAGAVLIAHDMPVECHRHGSSVSVPFVLATGEEKIVELQPDEYAKWLDLFRSGQSDSLPDGVKSGP
jgi:hypothetical protein